MPAPGVCTFFGEGRCGTDHRTFVVCHCLQYHDDCRHLPHWIPEETNVFVTWRLAGSPPPQADIAVNDRSSVSPVLESSAKHGFATGNTNRSAVMPASLPGQSGPTWLQDPRVARVVANALRYGEEVRRLYQLQAWVVMPNHAHAIFQPHMPMPAIYAHARNHEMAQR